MLSRYSVKRPFTIVVAVIIVLILGVVSYTRMGVDLIPNMNIPYALITTTYAGASPEEVESGVLQPMEQSMASISDVKSIQSVAGESYGMVIMEFNQSANMDSAMIEMRESLNLLDSSLPEGAGTPIIMKMNPEMLPISMLSVSKEGLSQEEISAYIENEIMPELESVPGVASASATGLLTNSVQVELSQEKIDALNDKLEDYYTQQVDEASAQGKAQVDAAGQQAAALTRSYLEAQARAAQLQQQMQQASTSAMMKALGKALEPMLGFGTGGRTEPSSAASSDEAVASLPSSLTPEQLENLTPEQLEALLGQGGLGNTALPEGGGKPEENMEGQDAEAVLEAALTQAQQAAAADPEVQKLAREYAAAKAEETSLSEQAQAAKTTAIVAAAALSGAEIPEYTGLPITKDTVGQLIAAQNIDMPSGSVTADGISYLVRTGEKIANLEELTHLPLMDLPGVGTVYLQDVADLQAVSDAGDIYAKVNGQNAILLSIQKQPDYSTADVSTSIQERLEQLVGEENGFSYTVLMDQGEYVHMMIDTIIKNLLIGGLLAIVILFVFLKAIRPTVIVGLSIVISVITAFVCMYFAGINLNIISMSGLALSVGMLVDNSIVVIENIFRLRAAGKDRKEAAVEGAKQMAGAITASTITTVVVFVPIFFTEGITRQLFTDLALTVAFSLLASLAVALTLVPAAAGGLLKKGVGAENKTFERITNSYVKALDASLRHKWVVFVLVTLLFAGSIFVAARSGSELFPAGDTGSITVSVELPEGYTRQQTNDALDQLSETLLSIEDIDTVGLLDQGDNAGMGMTGGGTSAYVSLKEKRPHSTEQVVDLIREKTAGLPLSVTASASGADLSAMTGGQIVVDVFGKELDDLRDAAEQVADVVSRTEGAVEVDNGLGDPSAEIRVSVDKEKAAAHNLTVTQVLMAVSGRLKAGASVTSLQDGGVSYDVYVKSGGTDELTEEDIQNIIIDTSALTGAVGSTSATLSSGSAEPVTVGEVAQVSSGEGFSSIRRVDKERCVQVTASLASGYNIGKVGKQLETALADVQLPQGCSYEIAGENENMAQSFSDLYLMLILAVIFIYLVMVAQFQSLLSPFIVMFTIPLAFTGGFFALAICGMSISVVALVGMVVLVGVVVNNGIVYVDCVNQRRAEGLSVNEALLSAARTRLRPICMTALTTIIALLAGVFDTSGGADMTRPMSVTIVGGMIYATFLTLFLVPAMYKVFHRKR